MRIILLLLLIIIVVWGGIFLTSQNKIEEGTVTASVPTPTSTVKVEEETEATSTSTPPIRVEEKEIQRTIETLKGHPVTILGWIPYWDQDRAFQSFKDHSELFDYISLFWYRLDSNGRIKTYSTAIEDQTMIDEAHEKGVKVLAIIANLPDYIEGGDWDPHRVDHVISNPDTRSAHVAALVDLAKRRNFDGINIDYEALERYQREDFTNFIQELGVALHKEGKLLGVALHPKTSENNPKEDNGSAAQDWKAIYPFVDHMYLMTYEEHYTDSPPGPIASIPWVDSILDYAVRSVGIPPEKVFMGIPLYASEWYKASPGTYVGLDDDLTYQKAQVLREQYQTTIEWDEASQSPFFTYLKRGKDHTLWFENNRSLQAKLVLQKRYRIPNLALWRLGGENEEIWATLQKLREE